MEKIMANRPGSTAVNEHDFHSERKLLGIKREELFADIMKQIEQRAEEIGHPDEISVLFYSEYSEYSDEELLTLIGKYLAQFLKYYVLTPYAEFYNEAYTYSYQYLSSSKGGIMFPFMDDTFRAYLYAAAQLDEWYKERKAIQDESYQFRFNAEDRQILMQVCDLIYEECMLESMHLSLLSLKELETLGVKAEVLLFFYEEIFREGMEQRRAFCDKAKASIKTMINQETEKQYALLNSKVLKMQDILTKEGSANLSDLDIKALVNLTWQLERGYKGIHFYKESFKYCEQCQDFRRHLEAWQDASENVVIPDQLEKDYRSFVKATSDDKLSRLRMDEVERLIDDSYILIGMLDMVTGSRECIRRMLLCEKIQQKLFEQKEKLQPYYDEVVNVFGGYLNNKLKERAADKLSAYRALIRKRDHHIAGVDKPLWYVFLGLVMLIGGIIFCKEMMQGAEYIGMVGFYSSEGMGIHYLAFLLWTVALFLSVGHFSLWGILIVTHLPIPLGFIFSKLPILYLICPIVGLGFFGVSVWSAWEDLQWSIYNRKAQKYFKKHLLPHRNQIWQEVKEKYGDIARLSDLKNVIE